MPKLKAVLFDLDDTLYPEQMYVVSGFRAVADWIYEQTALEPEETFLELCALFRLGVRGDTFDKWLVSRSLLPDALLAGMIEAYRDHKPCIVATDQVRAVLRSLGERLKLGLVTDGPEQVQAGKLAALGLAKYFDVVVLTDSLGPGASKPNPAAFRVALQAMECEGAEAVYCADNPKKDFLGARRAGSQSVRVRMPDGIYRHLEPESAAHAPTKEIGNLEQLEPLLEGFSNW